MRALVTIAIAAFVAAVPAAAQQQPEAAATQNSPAGQTDAQKEAKPAEKKVCKRTQNGRVCMTAEKWKQYEEMF